MRRLLLGVAAATSVLLLGVWSSQQTGALWRDRAQLDGGTIISGSLTILAGGAERFSWSNFGGGTLAAGSTVQQPLTISIEGDVDVGYRLQSVTRSSPDVPLEISAWIVGSVAGCPTSNGAAVSVPTHPIAGPWNTFPAPPAVRASSPGTSDVWCLRAVVGANAQQGKSTTVTLNFRADQQQ